MRVDSAAMNERELQQMIEFAVESAQLAGAVTLGCFNADTPAEIKADRTPVTAADRAAEQLLRQRIERFYPGHGILGEEFGEKPIADAARAPARWILDPIDGTISFLAGVPLYSVLVGLEWGGSMVAGVIHLPALGESIYAARGLGCWWNGRRARVSAEADVAAARVCCTSVNLIEKHGRLAGYERLRRACAVERGWSDAYAYALVATGRAEVALDAVMSIWDTAALYPVITEAGGRITDWRGTADHRAPEAVATNGRLHEPVLSLLNG